MRNLITLLLTVMVMIIGAQPAIAESLTEQLAALAAANKDKTPAEVKAVMAAAQKSLQWAGVGNDAPKVGDQLPDGNFIAPSGDKANLYDAIGERAAIVTFYRGGWCPYCNLQLHSYQQHLPAIEAAGATLVAITPETPDNSLSTAEKNELKFRVLSDTNNQYARSINIVFAIDEALKPIYQSFGVDLEKSQDNDAWELPLAATFIIDAERTVRYAFVDIDYTKRADPEELLQELQKLP